MKVVLFLLFSVAYSFATSYDDEWPIYVYGDASYYKLIFDGIAMIVNNSSFMSSILEIIALISTAFIARGFYRQNIGDVLWNTAASIGFIAMLLYPSSTVHVLDVRTLHGFVQTDPNGQTSGDYSGYQKVDNIPFYLAASASFATGIKYHIINISTDALNPIDGGSMRDSGFATPMRLTEDMITTASFKYSKDDQYLVPIFGQALSHYVEKCIIENALYIDQTQIHRVRDPKINQIDALNPNNFTGLSGIDITDLHGQPVTCGDFWNSNIAAKINDVKQDMQANLQLKYPDLNLTNMARSMTFIAGLDSDAGVALTNMQNAMLNIASSAVTMNAFSKAGAGLSGIDLSNEMTAQQSLFANMTDSTGQFKWMIRVVPVLEFLIFGILLFLGIPMGFIAGISGAEKGGKMLMNYTFGLIAFSFVDVALAIVQAISLYYYKNKMADVVMALGQNPYTASGIPPYIQEMGYMSGIMGLAAVIVVPIVVGVVFKGETAAAMGAYNSVMGKYKGDQGGQTALETTKKASAVHTSEAQQLEDAARRELEGGYGITSIPRGVLASQYLDQISAEAAALSKASSSTRLANAEYGGNFTEFAKDRARAGMGNGITSLTAEMGTGLKNLELTNNAPELSIGNQIKSAKGNAEMNLRKMVGAGLGAAEAFAEGAGSDFQYQVQTDAEASVASQAAKGKFSKDNKSYSREAQIEAAKVTANEALVKSVQNAKGLVDSGAFKSDGSIGKEAEFAKYAEGIAVGARMQTNKTMGVGEWAQGKSEQEMLDAMRSIQKVGAMGAAGEVSKGKGFRDGKYKGDLDRFESDMTDIEKSKSDSMYGQAEGVRKNYKKNPNIYNQNAEYGEESKQQATNAKIDTLGSVGKAVALDVTDASIKAVQQASGIEAYKTAGFVDDGGHVTGKGRNAFAISPTEMANQLGVKEDVLFGDDAGKNMVEQLKQVARKAGKSEDDINKALHSYNLTDENGQNPASGLALVGGLAKMGAMNYSASKALSFMGMTMSANIDGDANAKIVRADGGNAVNMANSLEVGDSTKINTEGKFKSQASAFQVAHGGRKPENLQELAKWVETSELAESSKNDFFGNLVNTIATYAGTEDKTELMAVAAGMGFGGHALKKAIETPLEGTRGGGAKLRDRLFGMSENESPNKSNDMHNNKPGNSHSEETTHNKSFNSDKDSMPNNSKSVNSERGFSQGKTTSSGIHVPDSYDFSDPNAKKGGGWFSQLTDMFTSNAGKQTLRSLPLIGAAAGVVFSAQEAMAGNYTRAGLELASAGADLLPGVGTAIGLSADAALMAGVGLPSQSAAPQHQGFTSKPLGYHTMQAVSADMQQQAAQAQLSMANNIQALSAVAPNSTNPTRSYVGFTMSDADQNPVKFTTDKTSRNVMMNGYDTGVGAQQFSSMMSNPESVSQFANAISQTSFSNVEAYNATNNILMDMNSQNQRAIMQQRVASNANDTNRTLQHKEILESNAQKEEKSHEF